MDYIGPLTFNAARFFLGFLVLIVLALAFQFKALKVFGENISGIALNLIAVGSFLFLASILKQYSLLYTDVANSDFFTIFYVLFVPVIAFFCIQRSFTGLYGHRLFLVGRWLFFEQLSKL